jgi:hypothetical protein
MQYNAFVPLSFLLHGIGWATVGKKECTSELTKYEIPRLPHVRLWDIPGAGTTAHPSKSYIGDYNIMAFDMIIIVNCGRITGQKYLFVWAEQVRVPTQMKEGLWGRVRAEKMDLLT